MCFQARTKELEGLQPKVEELQAQVQAMEGTKGWFERRLKEAEVGQLVSCLKLFVIFFLKFFFVVEICSQNTSS